MKSEELREKKVLDGGTKKYTRRWEVPSFAPGQASQGPG